MWSISMSDLPATEGVDPRFVALESWPSLVAANALWEGQMAALGAMRAALPAIAHAADAAALRLQAGRGRLIYCGAGTSARIGVQDGAELLPTFDWPEDRVAFLIAGGKDALLRAIENAEDRDDVARAEITALDVRAEDVVIALAASGSTPYALGAIKAARKQGALTIGIANSAAGKILNAAEIGIFLDTGQEPIAGSTRLKAGTAQKVALNLISTLIMVRLGRVYRGHMVDMVAKNEKLRARARRMVMQLANCDDATAIAALEQAGGKVKTALALLKA
jgi:N-acetylmuramic acid 6-phosphate etherase